MQELNTVRPGVQSGVTYGSPTFLVSPDVGTVFDQATLVIDTLNTSELATGSTVGTKADVICAPFPLDVLLWQLIYVLHLPSAKWVRGLDNGSIAAPCNCRCLRRSVREQYPHSITDMLTTFF